jgi:ABC-type antimicrobial peptide transport system permease subunit
LKDNLDYRRTMSRFAASLSASLGVLALASIEVYGVVSFIVARRMRETGIRIALGPTTRDIRNMMLKQTMRPVLVGMLIGAAAAAGTSKIFQGVLFGVSPLDPIAFVAAPLFLAMVAAAATLRPIRRAARADPILTLRCD